MNTSPPPQMLGANGAGLMHYLNPSTAPWPIAALVAAILLYLCFRLLRMVYRWWIALLERWDMEDEAHFQAIRRHHAKSHESDSRSF